eukprot:366029-Chlamydomonas_euryale.AAC.25
MSSSGGLSASTAQSSCSSSAADSEASALRSVLPGWPPAASGVARLGSGDAAPTAMELARPCGCCDGPGGPLPAVVLVPSSRSRCSLSESACASERMPALVGDTGRGVPAGAASSAPSMRHRSSLREQGCDSQERKCAAVALAIAGQLQATIVQDHEERISPYVYSF